MSDTTAEPEAVSTTEMDALLQRLSKLEDTVAELRDTTELETRIVERLRSRHEPVEERLHVERAAQPVYEEAVREQATPITAPVKSSWLLFEIFSEFKNMIAMLFDMHFHLGWMTRVVTIVILCVMMTGDWYVPFANVPFVMKIFNLILGFILFKIVTWETRRYVARRRPLTPRG